MNQKKQIKLILFDMDGTLLEGRSIYYFAEKYGFLDDLINIFNAPIEPYQKSLKIAHYLKGRHQREILEVFHDIPVRENVKKITKKIKEKNVITAIATDSYQFLADDLKKRLDFDYAFANNLILDKEIVTGEVILNNSQLRPCEDGRIYSICKEKILDQLCEKYGITLDGTLAIGDGIVDKGMIKKAGVGIAFRAPEDVTQHADRITTSLEVILEYL
jgi:phosphoserine phosphatase SerB